MGAKPPLGAMRYSKSHYWQPSTGGFAAHKECINHLARSALMMMFLDDKNTSTSSSSSSSSSSGEGEGMRGEVGDLE